MNLYSVKFIARIGSVRALFLKKPEKEKLPLLSLVSDERKLMCFEFLLLS
jgi:hypothetical protein